ncbi:exodeoxyribonuclease VII large subunit [Nakamurella sp. YIM 132087]|uniref:Exodeoxyribonuclease 7 large subunit n=1 Tax=Nakamurella alba TaxID=2665158 RepID=A0A7K1FFH4_9ACTN|nr:exodeoxyribonuclease VII large subunit [Nakamurella alba]MTD12862.1 exodeoxyribonuclease VII large subunit [Nakamurella alba]
MTTARPGPMPTKAGETTRENPWPVRALAQRMTEYIAKAPPAWIEGQIAQVSVRGNQAYLTLRDPSVDMSISVNCHRAVLEDLPGRSAEGARVVVRGRFGYWAKRGSLAFQVDEMHPLGLGELLVRLERLRKLLAAEGLTSPALKKALPFLPKVVGLVTGRASAAESDVLANARARWPAVRFRIENAAVQGSLAVTQVIEALQRLDADPEVEVIVLARGGGSTEDLLPFSDETLCRAVVHCRTPVVSAIGHEPDHPIVDDVADVRCSTPTDAGKRVVPDADAERRSVEMWRGRGRRALVGWVSTETARLSRLTSAAVLADPFGPLQARSNDVGRLLDRSRRVVTAVLDRGERDLAHRRAQLAALGPAATLARGYAVVQAVGPDGGHVLRETADAPAGTDLRIRVADGAVLATSRGRETDGATTNGTGTGLGADSSHGKDTAR